MSDEKSRDAEPMDPQKALRGAIATLRTSLQGAMKALEDPQATPGMIGAAFAGVNQAQQTFNATISRIPMQLVTDGVLESADQAGPASDRVLHAVDAPEPTILPEHELVQSTNARKWADHFLAINKNKAVDRETLVGWFANAIEAGRDAGRAEYEKRPEPPAATQPPEDRFVAAINCVGAAIDRAADEMAKARQSTR